MVFVIQDPIGKHTKKPKNSTIKDGNKRPAPFNLVCLIAVNVLIVNRGYFYFNELNKPEQMNSPLKPSLPCAYFNHALSFILAILGGVLITTRLISNDSPIFYDSLNLSLGLTVGLCFLMLAAFYFLYSLNRLSKLGYLLPSMVLFLSIIALLQCSYIAQHSLQNITFAGLDASESMQQPISPLVWVGLIMVSISCFERKTKQKYSALTLYCFGITLIGIASCYAINHYFDLSIVYGWNQLCEVGFVTALGFLIISIMLLYNYQLSKKHSTYPELDRLPKALFVFSILVTLFMCSAFLRQERNLVHETIDEISSNTRTYVSKALQLNFQALNRISDRWTANNGTSYAVWHKDAGNYYRDFKTYHALMWLDKDMNPQWSVSSLPKDTTILPDLWSMASTQILFQEARENQSETMSSPITINKKENGFFYVSPIFKDKDNGFDGFIVAIFSFNKFFSSLNSHHLNYNFNWNLEYKNEVIYTSTQDLINPIQTSMQTFHYLTIGDGLWSLRLTPTQAFIDRHQTIMPFIILMTGLLFSWFLSLTARFWQFFIKYRSNYKDLLYFSGDGIIGLDEKGNIRIINPAALKILQGDESQYLGTNFKDSIQHTRFDGMPMKSGQNNILLALKNGTTVNAENDVFWTNPRNPILVEYTCRPIFELGRIKGAVINFRDVTERKEIETQLRNSNLELSRMNQQMNEFNYIAAHDLKAPLRGIENATEFLVQDLGPKPSEQVLKDIGYIRKSVIKMSQLCKDLLAYSRNHDHSVDMKAFNLNTCVEEALIPINSLIEQTQATIDIKELPKAYVDFTLANQIFQNLIQNAIKYCKQRPHITISTHSEDERFVTIAIKDNGIGIDSQFQSKIFAPFQRLHTNEEYQGSGIGLSIVKKFAQVLQGDVWFESDGKTGSTFFIKLLKYKEDLGYELTSTQTS